MFRSTALHQHIPPASSGSYFALMAQKTIRRREHTQSQNSPTCPRSSVEPEQQPPELKVGSSNLPAGARAANDARAAAHVVRQVERFLGKEEAAGWIPAVGSIFKCHGTR